MQNLLSSGVWYNTEDVMEMYREVKQVVHLTEERGKSLTVGDSARLNGELKYSYDKLIEYIRQL
jgi:hypothetical protein